MKRNSPICLFVCLFGFFLGGEGVLEELAPNLLLLVLFW